MIPCIHGSKPGLDIQQRLFIQSGVDDVAVSGTAVRVS
jgi:hypothetical protein